MELNIALPENLRQKLAAKTACEPIYCIKTNISLSGDYTDRLYIGATEKEIFIFVLL